MKNWLILKISDILFWLVLHNPDSYGIYGFIDCGKAKGEFRRSKTLIYGKEEQLSKLIASSLLNSPEITQDVLLPAVEFFLDNQKEQEEQKPIQRKKKTVN